MRVSGVYSRMVVARILGMSLVLFALHAQAAEPFPDPLTLEQALSMADSAYPSYAAAQARQQQAAADLALARSDTGVNLSVRGEALYVEPSDLAADQSHDDSWIGLELRKKLYDFGVTSALVESGEAALEQQSLQAQAVLDQYRLLIMQRYLDVLLADHAFRVADEAMAIAYVTLDKLRDQYELGQVSDIELLEIETEYQEVRSERFAAQAQQRTSRMLLAEALGRVEARPRILAEPGFTALERELPPLTELLAAIRDGNRELLAAQQQVASHQAALTASERGNRPVLTGRAGTYEYQKDRGSRDEWLAGIELNVPLLTGGRVSAQKQRAIARWQEAKAERDGLAMRLRQRATELWERIQILQAERDAALTRMDYRELYLDRSRALYEMEVATDLGDAMVESTRARLKQAETEYALLLTWAELDILRGIDPWQLGDTP